MHLKLQTVCLPAFVFCWVHSYSTSVTLMKSKKGASLKSPHGVSGGATFKLVNFLFLQKKNLRAQTTVVLAKSTKAPFSHLISSRSISPLIVRTSVAWKKYILGKRILFKLTLWTMEWTNLWLALLAGFFALAKNGSLDVKVIGNVSTFCVGDYENKLCCSCPASCNSITLDKNFKKVRIDSLWLTTENFKGMI